MGKMGLSSSKKKKTDEKKNSARDESKDFWEERFRNKKNALVEVQGFGIGILRYYGPHKIKPGLRCGVELPTPTGRNNGTVSDFTYFICPENHGILVDPRLVTVVEDQEIKRQQDRERQKRQSIKRYQILEHEQLASEIAEEEREVNLEVAKRRLSNMYLNENLEEVVQSPRAAEELSTIAREQRRSMQLEEDEKERLRIEAEEEAQRQYEEELERQQREAEEALKEEERIEKSKRESHLEEFVGEPAFQRLKTPEVKEKRHPMLELYSTE